MCPLSSFIGILQVLQVTSIRFQDRTTDSRHEWRLLACLDSDGHLLKDATRYHRAVPTRQHAGPGPVTPDVPEPSLAERARTLAVLGLIGSLSTHSQKFPGFPFGSMMPYAADDRGRPIFLISSIAMHTHNLRQDPRASLLLTQPNVSGDPLGAARLTLLGDVTDAPSAEVNELYLSRHEKAKVWQDYTDFAYFRLQVSAVYFIGGFGVMGWISAEEYGGALPDPLAKGGSRNHSAYE
jgi:heme iron utilization protein